MYVRGEREGEEGGGSEARGTRGRGGRRTHLPGSRLFTHLTHLPCIPFEREDQGGRGLSSERPPRLNCNY